MSTAQPRRDTGDRFRPICVQAVEPVFLVDPKSKRLLDANEYAVSLTGYERDDLIGMSIYELRPRNEHGRLDQIFEQVAEEGEVRDISDTHIKKRDQTVVPVEQSSKVIEVAGEKVIVSTIRDISLRRRIEEELAEQTEDLEILNEIAIELGAGLDLDETLRRVMRHAVRLSGADAGAIAVVDPETGLITYPYIANMPRSIFDVIVARGGGLAGKVIESKEPTIVRDYPGFPGAVREFVEAGVIEIAAVPLISKGISFGALGVFTLSREHHFSDRNLRLLEGVGRLAGVAIENSRLYSMERRERVTLSAIEAISRAALTILDLDRLLQEIAKIVVRVTDICCGTIYLIEEGWLVARASTGPGAIPISARVRFGEGFAGQVASTGRVIAVPDATDYALSPEERSDSPSRSMIGIPLKVRERIVGVARFDTAEAHEFTRDEIRLFSTLADRAAVAIENVRLFESEKRRAEETSALMHLTSDLLSILDVKEFLHHVVEQAVSLVDAERGFAAVVSGNVLDMRELYSIEDGWHRVRRVWTPGKDIPGYVYETGEMVVVDDAQGSPLTDKENVLRFGIRNLIAAPVVTRRGDYIAVVVVANKRSSYSFSARDTELLRALVGQTSIGIENARLYEEQKHIAQTLQNSLLPAELPAIANTEVGVYYTSATSAALAGGDFYDIIKLPDGRIGFLIGDVSGKGVEAATTSALARFLVNVLAHDNPDPATLLTRANDILYRHTKAEEFVTVFFGAFDPTTGRLIYSNAGHPPPFTCGTIGCLALDGHKEMVSGAFRGAKYTNEEVNFDPGDGLVLYTDGLTEARRGSEFFGDRRLQKIIAEHGDLAAQELANTLFTSVKRFAGGKLSDDVAIVVIKRLA
ncbi:MAG: GAF domain-containing protein [Candidatus Aquicultorales bacterium]